MERGIKIFFRDKFCYDCGNISRRFIKIKIMKLAAIYNVWDGEELLLKSMGQVKNHVDLFIIVWQDISNWGQYHNPISNIDFSLFSNVLLIKYAHDPGTLPVNAEKEKRNLGIQIALEHNCTHFLHMDCDEFYQDFESAKRQYIRSGKQGSVCRILTYFKSPILRLRGYDNYFVPFIHKLKINTLAGYYSYPYYCDPTRRINTNNVCLINEPMHHFSWVRRNIERKANNSTARNNIKKSNLLNDYYSPETKEGSKLVDYQNQELIKVDDIFNLSEIFE